MAQRGPGGRERLAGYVSAQRYSFSWGRFVLSALFCWVAFAGLQWVAAEMSRSIAKGPVMYDDQAALLWLALTSLAAGVVAGMGVIIAPRGAFPRPKAWSPPVLIAVGGTIGWSVISVVIFGPKQSQSGIVLWTIGNALVLTVFVGVGTVLVKPPDEEPPGG